MKVDSIEALVDARGHVVDAINEMRGGVAELRSVSQTLTWAISRIKTLEDQNGVLKRNRDSNAGMVTRNRALSEGNRTLSEQCGELTERVEGLVERVDELEAENKSLQADDPFENYDADHWLALKKFRYTTTSVATIEADLTTDEGLGLLIDRIRTMDALTSNANATVHRLNAKIARIRQAMA